MPFLKEAGPPLLKIFHPKLAALSAVPLLFCSCIKKEEMVIYSTARIEGRISASRQSASDKNHTGGFAVFKNIYKHEERPRLALDLGNWISDAPGGGILGPQSVMDCMSAVPYSAAALGYRDLALTPVELGKLSKTASFPILASNLYLNSNKKPEFLRSYALLQAGGRKIGVFAVNISDPEKANQPKYLLNYRLEKGSYETEKAMKALKTAGAKITVMLLNINPKTAAKPEFYRKFLEKLPKTDLVITDEPSLKKPFKAGKSWVVPSGRGTSAARITLAIDPETNTLSGLDWDLLLLDKEKYGEDLEMLKTVGRHMRRLESHMGKRIGFLTAELKLRDGNTSPIGDFTAGCIKRWARSNAALLVNSELAAGLSSGPVTTGDLYKVMPHDTNVVFVKIRGSELAGALQDKALSDISASGLRISAGSGGIKTVETDSRPLVPGRVYHLAVPDSIVNSKDYPILPNAMEFANSKRQIREILGWCFSLRKTSSPAQEWTLPAKPGYGPLPVKGPEVAAPAATPPPLEIPRKENDKGTEQRGSSAAGTPGAGEKEGEN